MANSPGAKKRARQQQKRREHNAGFKSLVRTSIKKVLRATEEKNLELANDTYKSAVKILDRMTVKNIIHKNKAARHKSRLNAKIKALSA